MPGYIATLVFLTLLNLSVDCQHNAEDKQQTTAFTSDQMYLDIFPLTGNNFTEEVLKKPDPWVIVFHQGTLERVWKDLAVGLRGVVWVGMVDTAEESLLHEIKYQEKEAARVYPYGNFKTKLKTWQRMNSPSELGHVAVTSLPDHTQVISLDDLQDLLTESYMSTPSRFPVVLLTDAEETPPTVKAVANRFKKYFNFAKILNPTQEDFQKLGITEDFRGDNLILAVLVNREGGEQLEFNLVLYDRKTMGQEMTYPNILQFLFAINREYRFTLPGENLSNEKTIAEMEDVIVIEQKRFNILTPEQEEHFRSEEALTKPDVDDIDFGRDEL
ncbi:hypothetical protein ScPMuIL_001858 [Solemya velum]